MITTLDGNRPLRDKTDKQNKNKYQRVFTLHSTNWKEKSNIGVKRRQNTTFGKLTEKEKM